MTSPTVFLNRFACDIIYLSGIYDGLSAKAPSNNESVFTSSFLAPYRPAKNIYYLNPPSNGRHTPHQKFLETSWKLQECSTKSSSKL